ncbi:MAG: SAF domain-containing protein [Bifidobacteriaceae bacterium]|nr:SAF domain-containing protein [Bifidobacteriaceae bacterium]
MIDSERRRAARALAWRLRWAFAALFAALLVRIALPGIVQAFGDGDPVVVASHDIAAGVVLAEDDLAVSRAPPHLIPAGAPQDVADAVGLRTAVALPKASVVHGGLLTEPSPGDQVPAGKVAAVVRLSESALAGLVAPGDRLDIMASAGATASGSIAPAETLAHSALVLRTPSEEDAAGGAGLGGALTGQGGAAGSVGVLLVAVTPNEAKLIGGAASWAVVSAVLTG